MELPRPELESGSMINVNFLDPTVPFGKDVGRDTMPVIASVAFDAPTDGSLREGVKAVLDLAAGFSLDALHQSDAHKLDRAIQTNPIDPLALTEHEAAIVASWGDQSQKAGEINGADQSPQADLLSTPAGRVAAGAATGLAGFVGGFAGAAAPAIAQPNQVPFPAANVAKPFEFGLTNDASASLATTSEVSQQDCVKEAVARPTITKTEMKHTGVSGTQESYAHVETQTVSDDPENDPEGKDCAAAGVLRVEKFMFKTGGVSLEPGFFTFNIGNDAGEYTVYLTVGSKDKGLLECTPGPKKTKAEVDILVAAMDTRSHHAVAKRIYKAPIKKFSPKAC